MLPLSLPGIVADRALCVRRHLERVHLRAQLRDRHRREALPIGLAEFSTEYDTDWGAVMAASVIMTLPIAILFFGLQKLFVGGLISGGVKG